MTIYLLRHGEAVEDKLIDDRERPLSDVGQRQGAIAGRFLRSFTITPSFILTSPLLRARQMAEAVRREVAGVPMSTSEYLVSSTNPRQIVEQLGQLDVTSVLLVGHEPHLSKTISVLISGREGTGVELKKGSLASLEVSSPVAEGRGVLKWLLTSSQMEASGTNP